MTTRTVRVAAVQATCELMNRDATIDRVAELTSGAAGKRAQIVASSQEER